MFYFLLQPILLINGILIAAAVIPAIFLMVKVYRSDRLEKESKPLLRKLAIAGVLSTFMALLAERIGSFIIGLLFPETSLIYNILLYFVVVAVSEEGAKFLVLNKCTWSDPEFNCQYDGVVYAVFVSLGFALWENIQYVMHYGFSTAIVRAITAIPGHACFGVFMGVFYGLARYYANRGAGTKVRTFRKAAVIVPALVHGAYDFIASMNISGGNLIFVIFIVAMFVVSFSMVNRTSRGDRYI